MCTNLRTTVWYGNDKNNASILVGGKIKLSDNINKSQAKYKVMVIHKQMSVLHIQYNSNQFFT